MTWTKVARRSGPCPSVWCLLTRSIGALVVIALARHADAQTSPRLTDLSLEELANIEITSVSRYGEPLSRAAASIFVITSDDLRRSGARTLAEALRLAPNLQVARIDAGQYAITARGFNGLAANKLLVLLDGRTLYTPLFSGVFWDQQDVLLVDVERIEVISGPGATLWGTNAVNGVINVTTRHSRETQGAFASVGGGNRQQGAAFRYGATLSDGLTARAYGKATHFEPSIRADRLPVRDDRGWLQAGFRVDGGEADGRFTLQGDAYRVQSEDRGRAQGFDLGRVELTGQNLLGRWTRRAAGGSELQIQGYVDHARRRERVLFQPESTLLDVEFQHGVPIGSHRLVWGGGYRYGTDDVEDGFLVGFRPASRDLRWVNAYGQGSVRLHRTLEAAFGLKLERNDYTKWEIQPDARLGWMPSDQHLLWTALSRAVRAPARFDRDVIRPLGGVFGGPNFVSEVANVLQLGYRGRAAGEITWSITGFRHNWDRLRSATAPPVIFENRIEGPVDGVEAWTAWQPLQTWRLTAGVYAIDKGLRLEPGSTDPLGPRNTAFASDPESQWIVRSSYTAAMRHDFDLTMRRIGALQNPVVPAYTAVDARYAWRLGANLELSITGENLFDRSHPEFNALPGRSEFERGVYVEARWHR